MTRIPKAALTAALMLGVAVPLASPVFAKKKEEQAGQKGLTVNPKVREGQAAAVAAMGQVPALVGPGGQITPANQAQVIAALEAASPGIAMAEAAAQTNDELYVAQELRYAQQAKLAVARYPNDPKGQSSANATIAPLLERLLANPVTPPESVQRYALDLGRIQYLGNQFRPALANFQRARTAGSTDPLVNPLIVDTMVKLGDYAGAAAESDRLITTMKAAGQPVPESYYAVGIENAYRSKNAAAATQYEIKRLAAFPGPKNFHDALIRLMTRAQTNLDTRQRLDIWRLMRASKALADQKERQFYAQDALEVGASREAKAVLDEFAAGKPAGSLGADWAKLTTSANASVASATPLARAEAAARAGSDAQSALTAANFHYAAGDYAKAADLYKLAQQRNAPDKDALLLSLGAAQAQAGDKAGAQASFATVQASPRKEIAAYWQVWLAQP